MSVARGMRPLGGMPMRWRGARIRRDWAYADLEHGGEDRFEDKGAVLGSERGQICDEHRSDLRAVARRTGRWCGVLSQWVAQGGAKASPPPTTPCFTPHEWRGMRTRMRRGRRWHELGAPLVET